MDHEPIEEYKLKLKNLSLELQPEYKRINCPACDSVIPADNLNINDKIGKCNSCDIVFPFHKNISDLINSPRSKQEVIKPEGVDIFEHRDEKEFSIHQPFTVFDIFPLVIVALFTFLFTIVYFKNDLSWIYPVTSWILLMFPIYNLFQRKNHKVFLTIDKEFFHIKWRPKKWKKDKKYPIKEINQIYTKSYSNQNIIFMIVNGTNGQKHIRLIGEIMSLSKARYLEQEIEKYLGIKDREVPEEKK